MSLLEVKNLTVNFGGIEALKGISFAVEEGAIVTLIGANGAGKTTTLRAISGLVPASGGTITYAGESIGGMDTLKIVERGIALVPEGRRVFPNLTVIENLRIGAYMRSDKAGIEQDIEHIHALFPRLKERHWQLAGTLSGGEQQMLAVGRGLMSRPRILMMDEPSLGLAPMVVRDIFAIIRTLNQEGITILLIEQNANAALRAANYGYVLETGRIAMSGTGLELLENQRVREAYLGKRREQQGE
jgi:branched-chain amino acid transport system ATP-binding protein